MVYELSRKRISNNNGLEVSYLSCGPSDGQLVVFIHGFPEVCGSWRYQLRYFGNLGYHAVAADQRGSGETTGFDENDLHSFDALNLAIDCFGFIQALGASTAYVIGHDFGTTVAYHVAALRPDIVKGLMCLGIPLGMTPEKLTEKPSASNDKAYAKMKQRGLMHYQEAMCLPETEAAVMANPRTFLAKIYHANSADSDHIVDVKRGHLYPMAFPREEVFMSRIRNDIPELSFLDLDYHVAQIQKNGMKASLSWYKNVGRNMDIARMHAGRQIAMPYAFAAGEKDFCVSMYARMYDTIDKVIPKFLFKELIPDSGHWVQQEQPERCNVVIEKFLTLAKQHNAKDSAKL